MAKEVKMTPNTGAKKSSEESVEESTKHKLTYDELNESYNQLYQRALKLQREAQELGMLVASKRLDYLFKVIEHYEMFDKVFLDKCIDEIQESLTIKDTEMNPKEETEE